MHIWPLHNFLIFWAPLPCPLFMQPIGTVYLCNWAIFSPALPVEVICTCPLCVSSSSSAVVFLWDESPLGQCKMEAKKGALRGGIGRQDREGQDSQSLTRTMWGVKVHNIPIQMDGPVQQLAHCCRRGPRFDLSFQQKFQWSMNFWWKCSHRMQNLKRLTEGP